MFGNGSNLETALPGDAGVTLPKKPRQWNCGESC